MNDRDILCRCGWIYRKYSLTHVKHVLWHEKS